MTQTIQIPNKSHFRLDEVCGLTGVKPYVLRFWETEFNEISPITSSSGQRLFEHKDIEAIAYIKQLLFDKKMTIEQAKREIKLTAAFSAVSALVSAVSALVSAVSALVSAVSAAACAASAAACALAADVADAAASFAFVEALVASRATSDA